MRLLFPLALCKDFLQALSFNSHSRTSGLGHLLREFEPVHSHGYRILHRRRFANVIDPDSIAPTLSQRTRKDGAPGL